MRWRTVSVSRHGWRRSETWARSSALDMATCEARKVEGRGGSLVEGTISGGMTVEQWHVVVATTRAIEEVRMGHTYGNALRIWCFIYKRIKEQDKKGCNNPPFEHCYMIGRIK